MPRLVIGSTSASTSTTPVNSVLDTFTRADSATTLGANWSPMNFFGSLQNQGISSNQVYNPIGGFGNYCAMYWNVSTFTANQESYITISTLNSYNGNDNPIVYTRITNPGATFNGYGFSFYDSNGGCFISKYTNGSGTQISDTGSFTPGSGNKLRLEAIDSTLRGYIWNGSAWSLKVTVTDSTYSSAGRIGFYIPGNTQDARVDDFGGGSLADTVIPARIVAGTRLQAGTRIQVT